MEPEGSLDYRNPEWVAKRLGIEKNTVYRYLNEGTLPGLQLGRKWLISEASLAEFLKHQEAEQTERRRDEAQEGAILPSDGFLRKLLRRATERTERALRLAREEAQT